jgi:hypothetical protein
MSHFAQIKNGIVQQVIVAEQDFINTLPDSNDWIQTSYNTKGGVHYAPNTYPLSADGGEALNYNYAGIGYNWDGIGFYEPQPYPSWTLNKSTYLWESPVPKPTDDKFYIWDESIKNWVEFVLPNSIN